MNSGIGTVTTTFLAATSPVFFTTVVILNSSNSFIVVESTVDSIDNSGPTPVLNPTKSATENSSTVATSVLFV